MRSPKILILVTLLFIAGLVAALVWMTGRPPGRKNGVAPGGMAAKTPPAATSEKKEDHGHTLFVYCAAGLRAPMEAVARQYEQEFGARVEIQYGGSGTLLSNLRVAGKGDLFLAGDSGYIDQARDRELVDEAIPLARQRPVLAVAKGNPKGIRVLEDLLRTDVKAALANPEAASIGALTQRLFEKRNAWSQVKEATAQRGVFKPTVNEIANDLKLKTADAGVVWDTTVLQYPELEGLPIADAGDFDRPITVGVLRSTAQPRAALHFARYLGARDKGLVIFKKLGFSPVKGDAWEDQPQIIYYSGAVNRIAIQDDLEDFEEREGVRITTVFNGCGILLGQMKLGERPDVYHTCDASFMRGVEEFFTKPVPITEMAIVILTQKGNPRGLRTLADLGRPGLKIALANEKQSTLGALTADMLRQAGVYDAVQKNVMGTSPTGDLLVNQIRTGALDAVVVYKSNTIIAAKMLEVIPIDQPGATATQTFAIAKNSHHKQLLGRLFATLARPESVSHYEKYGFRWLLTGEPAATTATQAR